MKKAFCILGALFIFGAVSAQDSTYTVKKTKTVKRTERVERKKRNDGNAVRTTTVQTADTINRSTDPIRKPNDLAPADNLKKDDLVNP